jgi:protein gp37
MGEATKIEWADDTWSPWRGRARVSPGCQFCYAEKQSRRNHAVLGVWGKDGARPINADWGKPRRWGRKAEKEGRPRFVFPSMCDPFEDRPGLDAARERFLDLIWETPHLIWLVLTKRPENFTKLMLRSIQNDHHASDLWLCEEVAPPNLWLGVSVENQEYADERLPSLASIPAEVRFTSYEPALGPVDFSRHFEGDDRPHWVIVGGESGPDARPFDPEWARSTIRQCRAFGVTPFVKQMGDDPIGMRLEADKGGDWSEWPEDLRVRERPTPASAESAAG